MRTRYVSKSGIADSSRSFDIVSYVARVQTRTAQKRVEHEKHVVGVSEQRTLFGVRHNSHRFVRIRTKTRSVCRETSQSFVRFRARTRFLLLSKNHERCYSYPRIENGCNGLHFRRPKTVCLTNHFQCFRKRFSTVRLLVNPVLCAASVAKLREIARAIRTPSVIFRRAIDGGPRRFWVPVPSRSRSRSLSLSLSHYPNVRVKRYLRAHA